MKVVFIRQEVKVNEKEEGYNIYRSNLDCIEDITIICKFQLDHANSPFMHEELHRSCYS